MKHHIVIIFILWTLSCSASAQITSFLLKGMITDLSGKGVDGANVMLRKVGAKAMLGFTLSEADGSYEISVNTDADTLVVMISGFNISSHSRTVTRQTRTADFTVSIQEQKIREARVRADPIKRESDTLTYYVSQFKEETDRSIGDVLQKMPGIEVSASGGIRYNGKNITKFYIEGMDMLGGKYGIATNNIQASDIASVEVYENHQPLKVLQGWVKSDEAALNLKLRQGSKGTWNGIVEVGGGYSPAMWTANLSPMMFSRKFQTILTYKTNNTGSDVSQELRSQFGREGDIPALISVSAPGNPPLDESSWLRNDIHAASANGILKINDDSDITLKAHYIHDIQNSSGISRTEYFVPGAPSFFVEEKSALQDRSQELEVELQYRLNSKKKYILDELSVTAEKNEDDGSLSKDGSVIDQKTSLPFLNTTNRLQYVRGFGNTQVTAYSTTSFSSRDSYLSVNPNLYGEILGTRDTVRQDVTSTRLYSTNTIVTSYRVGRLLLGVSAIGNIDIESFRSFLAAADSMCNNVAWKKFDAGISSSLSYEIGRLTFDLSLPASYIVINGEGRPQFDPRLSARYRVNQNLTLRTSASRSHSFSGLYDSYRGYVMNSYRSISSHGGRQNRTVSTTASGEVTYSNAIHAFFVSTRTAYSKSESELTYGTVYNGDFTTTRQYDLKNESESVMLSLNASKRFRGISTTVKAGVDASGSHYQYIRQEQLMPVIRRTVSATFGVDTRIASAVLISYSGSFSDNRVSFDKSTSSCIKILNQSLTTSFLLGSHVIARTSFRHYYNDRNEATQKNSGFINAAISCRSGRMEYTLSADNLLDTTAYSSTTFSTNTIYSNIYDLRPLSVLLTVKFSLR